MILKKIQRAFKLIFPSGWIWADKNNGSFFEKEINGMSKQFNRDFEKVENLSESLSPHNTKFLNEWDREFFNIKGDLTESEQRGRLDGRWDMMFFNKSRTVNIESTLRLAGIDSAIVRTLGSGGSNESPYDFFPASGFSFFGASSANFGATDMKFGNTGVVGNALLLTNGGSIEYTVDDMDALVELQQNPHFWGAYFVVEGESNTVLEIPERLRETFFDILFLLKPAQMHGILNVKFI